MASSNDPLLSILDSWGAIYLAIGAALYFLFTPRGYDSINSARQILKFRDIDSYIAAKKEHAAIIIKIGEISRQPEISPHDAATQLNLLRISPFYDAAKHRAALAEAWSHLESGTILRDKLRNLYLQLHDEDFAF